MKIIELIIDEENEDNTITAISLVDKPAIEETFIALSSQEIKFAEVDKEKKIICGPALVPNRTIYRKDQSTNEEWYIFFSAETVRKASEMFFIKGNQSQATLEHKYKLENLTVVESWIIMDKEKDKSALYGMDLPLGTWMISMKVNDDSIWEEFVRGGKVSGFSIEAFFSEKYTQRPKDKTIKEETEAQELLDKVTKIIENEA